MVYISLNDILYNYSKKFKNIDTKIESRNASDMGSNKELIDEFIVLDNPRARNLYLKGRKNNLFATWAEILWVLGGSSKLDPVMTEFLPRCKDYSDDGSSWRGAYNTRIQRWNLLDHVIKMFQQDGLNTRRACFSIWSPELDSYEAIKGQHPFNSSNTEVTKDMPCTSFIWFWVRDNKFNCKVGLRSNDLVWGASSINIPEFTVIQEILYEKLKVMYPSLELGYYVHNPLSLHVYEKTFPQIEEIANCEENENLIEPKENFGIKISRYNGLQSSLKNIYTEFERFALCIRNFDSTKEIYNRMEKVFRYNNIPVEKNSLFLYATLPLVYLFCNKLKSEEDKSNFRMHQIDNEWFFSEDIFKAITERYFRQ